eukprot:792544-Rhodomonas_salina.2
MQLLKVARMSSTDMGYAAVVTVQRTCWPTGSLVGHGHGGPQRDKNQQIRVLRAFKLSPRP